jgi:sporulation protein YlmC with PRC-barrel domain
MKSLFSDLKGKSVMSKDGEILGTCEDFIVESHSGKIDFMLIKPAETIEPRLYKQDAKGRIMLPFKTMRAVRDVIVVDSAE